MRESVSRSLLVLAGISLGVALGSACMSRAGAQAPPPHAPPHRPPGESPPAARGPMPGVRYQYACYTDLESKIWKPDAVANLNRLGADGWRLLPMRINQASDQYCFERAY